MTNTLTTRDEYVNVKSLKEVTAFSKELKSYIVNQELYTPIANKNYVNVEGWEFAGAAMGIFPIVKETINRSEDGEIKYEAKVELLRVSDDKIIGTGVAVCSNKEKGRNKNDEFVILSMAQTRATGKAFRLCIGWVMKLAGYEAVATEEMSVEGLMPMEKDYLRRVAWLRKLMNDGGYDTEQSKRAFIKTVLGKTDEVADALANEVAEVSII